MAPPLDSAEFRKVVGRFATGVTVVTSRDGDDLHGMTCNAFCSVSLIPPTILVSLAKETRTRNLVEKSRCFAVNILSDAQADLSDRFAGRHKDKETNRFEGFAWETAATGAPVFAGVHGWLDCRLRAVHDGGTHALCVGEVVQAHVDDAKQPLIFYRSKYTRCLTS